MVHSLTQSLHLNLLPNPCYYLTTSEVKMNYIKGSLISALLFPLFIYNLQGEINKPQQLDAQKHIKKLAKNYIEILNIDYNPEKLLETASLALGIVQIVKDKKEGVLIKDFMKNM